MKLLMKHGYPTQMGPETRAIVVVIALLLALPLPAMVSGQMTADRNERDVDSRENPRDSDFSIEPDSPDGTNGWYSSQPTVSLKAPDDMSVEYYVESDRFAGTTYMAYSGPFQLRQGTNTVYYRFLNDTFTSNAKKEGPFKVDDQAPGTPSHSITPSQPDGKGGWYITPPVLELKYTVENFDESDVSIYYYFNSAASEATKYTQPLEIASDGNTELTYYVVDEAGHRTPEEGIEVILNYDAEEPDCSASVTPPAPDGNNGWYINPPTVSFSSPSTDVQDFLYSINDEDREPEFEDFTSVSQQGGSVTINQEGNIFLFYMSEDRSGRSSPIGRLTVNVDTEIPEDVEIVTNPEPEDSGWFADSPIITLTADEVDSSIYYSWDDSAPLEDYLLYDGHIDDVEEGNSTLRYYLLDDAHFPADATVEQVLFQVDSTPPVAILPSTIPETFTGQNVTVDASKSTDNLNFLEYTFDFGDGTAVDWTQNPVQSHAYENGGIFKVSLKVRDRVHESGTVTVNINVIGDQDSGDDDDDDTQEDDDGSDATSLPDPTGMVFDDDRFKNVEDSDKDGVPDWYEINITKTNPAAFDATDKQRLKYRSDFESSIREAVDEDDQMELMIVIFIGIISAIIVVVFLLVIRMRLKKQERDEEMEMSISLDDPNLKDPNRQQQDNAQIPSSRGQTIPSSGGQTRHPHDRVGIQNQQQGSPGNFPSPGHQPRPSTQQAPVRPTYSERYNHAPPPGRLHPAQVVQNPQYQQRKR